MTERAQPRRRARWIGALVLTWLAVASPLLVSLPAMADQSQPILTITAPTAAGSTATVALTRAELEALPQVQITSSTPWTEGATVFEGPLARDVLAIASASGTIAEAVAINDYRAELPVQDFFDYDVILALRADDALLTRRDKGPLWIVYPKDDHPELDSIEYFARWVWQLTSLRIE